MKKFKTAAWISAGIIVWVLSVAYMYKREKYFAEHPERSEESQKSTTKITYPRTGTFKITPEYREDGFKLICEEGGHFASIRIVTPGVYWEVRYDGDPNRVQKMYPCDSGKVITNNTPAVVYEARILPLPGQDVKEAICSYTVY